MNSIKKERFYDGKIGRMPIYHEQQLCSNKIMEIFQRRGGPPLLLAQPQQGKTGVMACVIKDFISYCERLEKKYEVIVILNLSGITERDQLVDRLKEDTNFQDKINVFHHPNLHSKNKKIKINKSVELRLIIMDECHIALGEETPLHNFFKECGINYGESIDTWENKDNFLLSVSATPFVQVIKSKIDSKSFEPVYLEKSDSYFGIKEAYEKGRLLRAEATVEDDKVSSFFLERVAEFRKICRESSDGYMVVRAPSKKCEVLKKFLSNTDMLCKEFSEKEKNINKVDEYLSKEALRPTVILIKNALRASKTLTTTKYIRMWIDTPESNADTYSQSIGRCFGNCERDTKRLKENDLFKIYGDISEVPEIIKFYDDFLSVPSGTRNNSTGQLEYKTFIYETAPSDKEILKKFKELNNNTTIDRFRTPSRISRTKSDGGEKILDLLKSILDGSARRTSGQQGVGIYYIDGIKEAENEFSKSLVKNTDKEEFLFRWITSIRSSYSRLKNEHPNWDGKYVLMVPMNADSYKNKISPKCLIKE